MQRLFTYLRTHPHRIATAAFVFGFVVDIITFRALDLVIAQLILAAHLVIVASAIVIMAAPAKDGFMRRIKVFAPIAHQYSTGSLLSPFLVLYASSGSLSASWPFLAIVLVAAIGNETLRLKSRLLPFQTTLFFFNLLLFAALAVPMALGTVGVPSFLAAVLAAAVLFGAFTFAAARLVTGAFKTEEKLIRVLAGSTIAILVFLYFTNLIPPIPLSVKSAGFYHSIVRDGPGYDAVSELHPWYGRFLDLWGETLHLAPGERAYAFTAIFAPARVDTEVAHRWERYNGADRSWERVNRSTFPIAGGRHGGYRGYTYLENPAPGRYRVSVETARGQVIGRRYVTVVRASTPVPTRITEL